MSNVICITNRKLVDGDFLRQIEYVAGKHPKAVILREKDLPEKEYEQLAERVQTICKRYGVPFYAHTYVKVAIRLNADGIHLPYSLFLTMTEEEKKKIKMIGVSTHAKEEAVECEKRNASYITTGHIFATDCKKGLPPRGIPFLKEVCDSVTIPVYAIGGITENNYTECIHAGAKGVCLMSSLMKRGASL